MALTKALYAKGLVFGVTELNVIKSLVGLVMTSIYIGLSEARLDEH